ncbi:GNAT family N-acetyltransferase [Aeromonas simiae]|uniref:GNAT family N-acetyltransferase n=1 Tax=Aeromonas simiae TaxID=218936 RepID=A0A5J6WV98_9GAMM|nr:GNAT family N-acetyltransferase [Aeromonas simiae]QFI54131.1 GNAT family N-acetyltransferase [Aeromonas simiae]
MSTLTFEEYYDADLTLIRDFYETAFSRYEPDIGERIFIAKDANWLVGALRVRAEERYYHLCGMQLLPHYQQQGIGQQLLSFACGLLDGRPIICQVLPFERDFYMKVGFRPGELHQLPEPLRSRLHQQQELGYCVEPLVRSAALVS